MTLHGPGEWGNGPLARWATQADFYAVGITNPTRGIWLTNTGPDIYSGADDAFYFAKDIRIENVEFKYFGREGIYSGLINPAGAPTVGNHYYFNVLISSCVFRQNGGDCIRSDALGENWVLMRNEYHGMHGWNETWLEDDTVIYSNLACTVDSGTKVRQGGLDGPMYVLVNPAAAYKAQNQEVVGDPLAVANGLREYQPRYRLGVRMYTNALGGYGNEVTVLANTFKGYGTDSINVATTAQQLGRQGGCLRIDGPAYVEGCELDLYWGVGIAIASGTVHTCHFGNHNGLENQQNQTVGDAGNKSFAVFTSDAKLVALRYEGMNWRNHQAVHVANGGNVDSLGPTFGYTQSAWWTAGWAPDLANVTYDSVYSHNFNVDGGAVVKVRALIGWPMSRLDKVATTDVRFDMFDCPWFGPGTAGDSGFHPNVDNGKVQFADLNLAGKNYVNWPMDAAGNHSARNGQDMQFLAKNSTGATINLLFSADYLNAPSYITVNTGEAVSFRATYWTVPGKWVMDSVKAIDARILTGSVVNIAVNVALGKAVARSDNNDAVNVAANATDGNAGTYSYAYVPGTTTWTRVDLGAGNAYVVGRVVIKKLATYTPFDVYLEKSDDGVAWTQIGQSLGGQATDTIDVTPTVTRYLRITTPPNAEHKITEFEVYAAVGGPALPLFGAGIPILSNSSMVIAFSETSNNFILFARRSDGVYRAATIATVAYP
jgi:hypothetical protein